MRSCYSWTSFEPRKRPSDLARAIALCKEILLPPASIWELGLLVERKQINVDLDFGRWRKQSIRELSLQEVPFSWDVGAELPFTRHATSRSR
jgi:PIN domain nuclease of toxin-antitoxin system